MGSEPSCCAIHSLLYDLGISLVLCAGQRTRRHVCLALIGTQHVCAPLCSQVLFLSRVDITL